MQKTLAHRNITFAYEDEGHGHAVILLHGFAEDGTVWKHQVQHLKDSYRVIIPDWPGSGLSPLPQGENAQAFSMELFAELVHALLHHEKIARCCVIGHSMGGYVTLAFAEAYSNMLYGFGLFHSTSYADSAEKQAARKRGIAFMNDNGAALFVKQSVPNLFADTYKQEHPDEVAALVQRGAAFSASALIQYYQAMLARPDRREVLSKTKLPLLLIAGAKDNAVPLPESLAQASLAESTFFHVLEDAAHMGMWEATDVSNRKISDYLAYIFSTTNKH